MIYNIIITPEANMDLDKFIQYLLTEKKSHQAAVNLIDDFDKTVSVLSYTAGSLKLCTNPRLQQKEYRRMNLLSHNYFLIFKITGESVYVLNVFHLLQDFENLIK